MQKIIIAIAILSLLPILFAGCGEEKAEAKCSCEVGKAGGTIWCEKCGKGYLKGEGTECQDCVTARQACEKCAKK
jgi:hypothetical protein